MSITVALGLFFLFILVYLIIIEIFTVCFRLTGMTAEDAKFQVISMLTNCGFTTKESEIITISQVRKQLAKVTIMFGYSFTVIIVSIFLNVFMTWNQSTRTNLLRDSLGLVAAFSACLILMRLKWLRRGFDHLIERIGNRVMFGKYANVMLLVNTYGDKVLVEIHAKRLPDFLKGTMLMHSTLKEKYEILILIVRRNGDNVEHVGRYTILEENDTIVAFGPYQYIQSVFEFPDSAQKDIIVKTRGHQHRL